MESAFEVFELSEVTNMALKVKIRHFLTVPGFVLRIKAFFAYMDKCLARQPLIGWPGDSMRFNSADDRV